MVKKSMINKICKCSALVFVLFTLIATPGVIQEAQAGDKEMTLVLASYVPVNYPYIGAGQQVYPALVNKQGKGVVQLKPYFSGTLLKGKQILPGLQAGTADIVFQTGAYLLGSYPIIGIQILPVWDSVSSSYKGLKVGTPLADLQNEYLKKKNLYQLATAGMVPEFLFTRNKLVRKPGDVKGLKIRVAGKVEGKVIQALGGSPVTLPSAELSQALQRGVVDGALMNPWTAQGRGIEEFCKYMLVLPLTCQTTPIYVMRDKWESWPQNVRKVLTDAAVEWEGKYIAEKGAAISDSQLKSEVIPFYTKHGVNAIYPTKNEAKAFRKTLTSVVDWWVKRIGETGKKALTFTDYSK